MILLKNAWYRALRTRYRIELTCMTVNNFSGHYAGIYRISAMKLARGVWQFTFNGRFVFPIHCLYLQFMVVIPCWLRLFGSEA